MHYDSFHSRLELFNFPLGFIQTYSFLDAKLKINNFFQLAESHHCSHRKNARGKCPLCCLLCCFQLDQNSYQKLSSTDTFQPSRNISCQSQALCMRWLVLLVDSPHKSFANRLFSIRLIATVVSRLWCRCHCNAQQDTTHEEAMLGRDLLRMRAEVHSSFSPLSCAA